MAKRSRGKSPFRGKVSANAKRQQQSGFGYLNLNKDTKIFKEEPKDRVFLDFIPYYVEDPHHLDRNDDDGVAVPGAIWYKKPFKIHRNVGAANDTIVCPTTINKACPICEYRQQQIDGGAKWNDEDIKALRPKDRNLYNVIPLGHKKYDEEPHVWDISQYLFQEKLNEELEEWPENDIFPDLEEGLSIRIRFTEEAIGNNTFADTGRIDFEERDYVYDEEDVEQAANLDEMLSIMSYDQIHAMFFELESPDEDDAEPVTPAETRSRPKRRKRKQVEPADEEEYPGPEMEEPEEEEKPKRKRRTSKRKRKPESRKEERAAAREEAEEEKPRKTRRRRSAKPEKDEVEEEVEERIEQGEDRCPYGHRFGVDAEEYDDCDYCDEWADCIEEKELAE
jgi:hypothetical protein